MRLSEREGRWVLMSEEDFRMLGGFRDHRSGMIAFPREVILELCRREEERLKPKPIPGIPEDWSQEKQAAYAKASPFMP